MIPLFKVHMPDTVVGPLTETLLSGYIGQGPKVDLFEKGLGPWVGLSNAVAVNSGTSALHLALHLAGVGAGTEVISTPMTCVATNSPVLCVGAQIVWADIDPWTGNIDPLDVERKITGKTRAILAVHWGGYPCELGALGAVAAKYGVALIEDAAHAFGATYRGKKIGSVSPYTTFSFQAIKHLTTGDGGLLTVRSNDEYRRAKLLRWYGIDRETPRRDLRCEEDIKEIGFKFHMNDLAATIGLEQLKTVGRVLEAHRANAAAYDVAFADLRRVKKLRYAKDREGSYWLYTIRTPDPDGFLTFMAERDVMVSKVHVRNDLHTAFRPFRKNLPGVDEFSAMEMSIPVGWWVGEGERKNIIGAVEAWDRSA